MSTRRDYIPALGHDFLTPLYDPLVRLTMRDTAFKRRLLEQAQVTGVQRVLDVGCGTGTLLALVREEVPSARVAGIDGDLQILAIAQRKAGGPHGLPLVQAFSFALPFTTGCFDRVFSTLMLHHLTRDEKLATLREIVRVLRPNGELHVADWGPPHNRLMQALSLPLRIGHHSGRIQDNLAGALPSLLRQAGLEDVREHAHVSTLFGTLALYGGHRPSA
jgi:ubiquinone/menaquinone biosynthesis C-methylase UbiE